MRPGRERRLTWATSLAADRWFADEYDRAEIWLASGPLAPSPDETQPRGLHLAGGSWPDRHGGLDVETSQNESTCGAPAIDADLDVVLAVAREDDRSEIGDDRRGQRLARLAPSRDLDAGVAASDHFGRIHVLDGRRPTQERDQCWRVVQ